MRWVRFRDASAICYGVVEDDRIFAVEGSPFGEWRRTGREIELNAVQLLPPVVPPTFYCIGYNYPIHTAEVVKRMGLAPGTRLEPDINYRAVNALIGHGEEIVIPSHSSGKVQFEGELVAVIGTGGRHIREEDALKHVLGYTIGNDVSERQWQRTDSSLWRGKNADTFKPMGPWIETDVVLDDLVTTTRLNGMQVSEFKTSAMMYSIQRYIAEISRSNTLATGDILWLGTEYPVRDMVPGDEIEIEIRGIGSLRNKVVAERH